MVRAGVPPSTEVSSEQMRCRSLARAPEMALQSEGPAGAKALARSAGRLEWVCKGRSGRQED